MKTETATAVRRPSVKYKIAATVATLAVIATGGGTFAAFTATTANSSNRIDSGTVKVDQHTGAVTLYSVTNQKPGDVTTKCVRVAYTGSLTANMKLYVSSGITNGTLYNIRVERGTGLTTLDSTMSCAGFTFGSDLYPTAALGSFATSYAAGYDGKASAATWTNGNTVDYRFTITQNDDATVNAHTTVTGSGLHTFTWEARNS